MQLLFESNYQSFHEHPNQYFFRYTMEKTRPLQETVLVTELQLHISSILENGMTPYFPTP